MSIRTIVKSDGTRVPFDPEKLNKWAKFASDNNVKWSDITLRAYRKCYDGCSTKDIHTAMIDSCVEVGDKNHLRMAGRLYIGQVYKDAHGGHSNIPTLKDFYHDMVERGLWVKMDYTDEELEELEKVIDHDKNLSENYSYTTIKQIHDKYLIRDLVTGKCYESPQFLFMGISLQAMENQPKERRLEDVTKLYTYLSDLKINVSTPMLVNLRTPKKGLASCCVYTTNDTAPSLAVGDHIAYMMTCASAGIGSHIKTRSKGDPVRQGQIVHRGKLPYLRSIQSAVHANIQACYDDETYILTNSGYKLFKDLNDDDLVAQVGDDGTVEFTETINGFEYDFDGELVSFKNGDKEFLVTDNHKMVYIDNAPVGVDASDEISNDKLLNLKRADELEIKDTKEFMVSTRSLGAGRMLNSKDMLYTVILSQNENIDKPEERDKKTFIINTKIGEFDGSVFIDYILDDCGVEYTKNDHLREVVFKVPFKTKFDNTQNTIITQYSDMNLTSLLSIFSQFSGSENERNLIIKSDKALDLISSMASLSGRTLSSTEEDGIYKLELLSFSNLSEWEKTLKPYKGKIYCVEVPTNKIIVKRGDATLVCGNSRGGANTTYFSVLDPEIDDLLVLKNPTTILEKRIRDIDYALSVNRLFAEKVIKNEDWYTISYYYAPDLHEAFYSPDYDEFLRLYKKYENHEKAVKRNARDIIVKALNESISTGRIYIHYADEANRHTPFKEKIYSSNLCNEIALPTKGFTSMPDLYRAESDGEIGLCSLSSVVVGRIEEDEYEDVLYYTALLVDNTIDIMEYAFPSLEHSAKSRRSIGIGMTNLAHDMAKRGLSYATKEGKKHIHRVAERHAYYLYKASLRLGKEKGNAPWIDRTKIPEGWLPIDTYNKNVDKIVENDLQYDWETLRKEIIENGGIRNSTLVAIPPNESSSLLTNTTNSIYPIRSLRVVKTFAGGRNILLAPDAEEIGDNYDIAWELDSKDIIDLYAIVQKFTDQGISADLYISYRESETVSTKQIIKDFYYMMLMGCKGRYYINSQSGVDAQLYRKSGVEVIDGDQFCDSCVL